ncbi:hypothetical protein NQZ68_026972 [Dissostichus eleginoides]|uniref:Rho-GTPase-activating protein 6 n=1 Tax=Dissostichus eleginoides TaxID=100907 RepID=A0AAD9B831_DISEL|nr:hypothetical protein NQZ68_026972 [Dissostichus eleginoides]KAK1877289.1 putative Rho-GTPase-activating protein 6 [Dissostichus eleginoides]
MNSCPVVGVSAAGRDTAHWKEVKLKVGQEDEPSCEHEALLTQQLCSFLPTEVWLLRFGLSVSRVLAAHGPRGPAASFRPPSIT